MDVAVYFESLCPDSIKFIIEQLYPTYQKLYGKHIFKIDLVPYGNVKVCKIIFYDPLSLITFYQDLFGITTGGDVEEGSAVTDPDYYWEGLGILA